MQSEGSVIIGDSHVAPIGLIRKVGVDVVSISGGTMSGIKNPVSKTNSFNIINASLERKKYRNIVLCLGEVDVGFLCMVKNGASTPNQVKENIQVAVDTYREFVDSIESRYSEANVYVTTVCPPVMSDYWLRVSKIKARRELRFSFDDRSAFADFANQLISSKFAKVIDLAAEIKGKRTGASSHINPRDHHYSSIFFCQSMRNVLVGAGVVSWRKIGLYDRVRLAIYDLLSFVR